MIVGGRNRWTYDSFVNWEMWWPGFPILVYFKVRRAASFVRVVKAVWWLSTVVITCGAGAACGRCIMAQAHGRWSKCFRTRNISLGVGASAYACDWHLAASHLLLSERIQLLKCRCACEAMVDALHRVAVLRAGHVELAKQGKRTFCIRPYGPLALRTYPIGCCNCICHCNTGLRTALRPRACCCIAGDPDQAGGADPLLPHQ